MKTLKKFFHSVIILTGLILGTSFTIHSQNLAVWNFEGDVTTPSFTQVNIMANPAAFGSGVVVPITPFVAGNPGRAYTASNWATGMLDPNKYIEFTIGPVAGYMMSLASFGFDHRRSSTGVRAWELRSSLDSYTSTIASKSIADVDTWFIESVSLPINYEDLSANVSFRIYGFTTEASAGTWRFDDVYFTGTAEELPVPPVPLSDWAIVIGLVLISTLVVIRYSKLT